VNLPLECQTRNISLLRLKELLTLQFSFAVAIPAHVAVCSRNQLNECTKFFTQRAVKMPIKAGALSPRQPFDRAFM
jgi:hypothetical protein